MYRTDQLTAPPLATPADLRAARRALRDQVERLERQLARVQIVDFTRGARDRIVDDALAPAPPPTPRLLSLEQLEALRDELVVRLHDAETVVRERRAREQSGRERLVEMYREPERHRFEQLTNADLGQPGCRTYAVRPRLGLIGILSGWWRLTVSSGCPLAPADHDAAGPRPIVRRCGRRSAPGGLDGSPAGPTG